jgi:hypothetical protein
MHRCLYHSDIFTTMKIFLILALAAMGACAADEKRAFVHPGIWYKQEDFDRMIPLLQQGREPWYTSAARLIQNSHQWVGSGAQAVQTNAYALQDSGINILRLALTWAITGDESYGNAARDRINEWSIYRMGGDCLRNGIGAGNLVNAAEIIRHVTSHGKRIYWPEDQITNFQNMLTQYMMPTLETLRHGGEAGFGTPAISAMAAIGVFCDNTEIYDRAIALFKYGSRAVYPDGGSCNGVLEMIDWKGQSFDSGRDQPHAQGLMSHLFDVAIVSWNQGTEDLFAYGDNRLLLGMEYSAKFNLGEDVPYSQQYNCRGQPIWGTCFT